MILRSEHGGNPLFIAANLDMSANLNPLGIAKNVKKAAMDSAAKWEMYPDPYCTEIRRKIARKHNIDEYRTVCGNGADDLIYRIVLAFCPKKALVCAPTFSEYRKALEQNGCEVFEHFLNENDDFLLDLNFFDKLDSDIDMLFVCSPNNPTGQLVSPEILRKTAEICRRNGTILVCDESFLEFTESVGIQPYINENVIILKSMTKIYAIAGLRLGYAITGSAEIAEKVRKIGQFWSVSAPAQAAGIAALDEVDYVRKTVELITSEREWLSKNLAEIVEKVYPSDANFLLFKAAPDTDEKLAEQGILIRSCANYSGLDSTFFRTAVRTRKENEMLINALRRCGNG